MYKIQYDIKTVANPGHTYHCRFFFDFFGSSSMNDLTMPVIESPCLLTFEHKSVNVRKGIRTNFLLIMNCLNILELENKLIKKSIFIFFSKKVGTDT